MTKLKNANGHKKNSDKTLIVTKLLNSNCDKTQNSVCDKTQIWRKLRNKFC